MKAFWAGTALGGCMGLLGILCFVGGCMVGDGRSAKPVDLISVRGCAMEMSEAGTNARGLEIRLACPAETNEATR